MGLGTKDTVLNEHLCDAKKEGFSILSCTEEINYVCIDDRTLSCRPFLDSAIVARFSPSGFCCLSHGPPRQKNHTDRTETTFRTSVPLYRLLSRVHTAKTTSQTVAAWTTVGAKAATEQRGMDQKTEEIVCRSSLAGRVGKKPRRVSRYSVDQGKVHQGDAIILEGLPVVTSRTAQLLGILQSG